MEIFLGALEVMGFGVGGVFLVLTIFYFLVKLMLRLFPEK
ncbi:MAG TPA: OadG-related small transporter subunit [Candidatus Atribacteria bacterium]|nr:OadG-related small transporter subunit [Candidatus Atribacteria bacterium]HPT78086.1 OadG-related small transporter subunit [Candidatus Atribacteria bacterium]